MQEFIGNPSGPIGTGPIDYTDSTNWKIVATADFNRDGQTDLLWRMPSTGQNAVWFMNGTNMVSAGLITTGGTSYYVVGTGDFNSDGYSDIVWRDHSANLTYVWYLGAPAGTNLVGAAQIAYYPTSDWHAVGTGDFNNDSHTDLFWRRDNGDNAFWRMNGVTLQEGLLITAQPDVNWSLAATGQFGPVGETDLLWRHSNGQNAIWRMSGTNLLRGVSISSLDSNFSVGGVGGHTNMMMLSATSSPPNSITLSWRYGADTPVTIERKTPSQSTWTPLQSGYRPLNFTDSGLTVGQRYEYRVAGNYLVTAINAPPVDDWGKVILVIDNTIASAIATELNTLKTNLAGDGWSVISTNVPRHDDVTWANNVAVIASIKGFITNTFNADPSNTKAVFLVGHVPIPYSGFHGFDGHGERCAPSDGYYGDVDGVYTDNTNNPVGQFSNDPRHDNVAGDGKFDQNQFPSDLELAVGRIDCLDLPAYAGKTEVDLLKQYLNKNDRYRRKLITVATDRVVTGSYFYTLGRTEYIFPMFAQGLRNGSRLVGNSPGAIVEDDVLLPNNPALLGVHGGHGTSFQVEGKGYTFHTSTNLATPALEPQVPFCLFFGSFFWDWAYPNDLMRAFVAMPNYGLGAMYVVSAGSGFKSVLGSFEPVAMGEPIGAGYLRTINENPDTTGVDTFISILGDPTLRFQLLAPPTNLSGNSGTDVTLNWSAPPEAGQYFVYRSTNNLDGPWTKLTTNPISLTTYNDNPAPSGSKMYRVRALKVTTTASGSYTNLSQGIFTSVN
ncbi:MAG: FG-GAP-like repeat-containing protein [Verrucomicrobia bacterium]|nr:FG-GAP-like repeat-containing protein [Verrucomicrobiota bacterium]